MIRSSNLYYRNGLNSGKKARLNAFIAAYRYAAQTYVDYLWDKGFCCKGKRFSVKEDLLNVPPFLWKGEYPEFDTQLSARALKCCLNQVLGIIKGATEKRRRNLWIKSQRESKSQPLYKKLVVELAQPLVKPFVGKINPELNSSCADFQEADGKFDGFLQLKYIGKAFGKIKIPIKFHRQLLKWKTGRLCQSFMFTDNYISFRFESSPKKKKAGKVVGADSGLKTVLTLSNSDRTPKQDRHGHSLESIIGKVARKKKGSKNFRKAAKHRENFIHWSINRLNLAGIRQINLENVVNINLGKRANRKMQAWTYGVIRDKVVSLAEEQGVLVVLQDSPFKSQRCSKCGMVRKSNRKGEVYSCNSCGNAMNADLNAAINNSLDLPKIPYDLCKGRKNLKGFFWNLSGFSFPGTEFTVPTSERKEE
jgi:transposase